MIDKWWPSIRQAQGTAIEGYRKSLRSKDQDHGRNAMKALPIPEDLFEAHDLQGFDIAVVA